MLSSQRWIFSVLILALASGCGAKSQAPAKLSGKVTYKGEALPAGMIVFHSQEDKGSYQAQLQPDGTFEIVDIPFGKMIVTVDTEFLNPAKKVPAYPGSGGKAGEDDERVAAERKMGAKIAPKGSAKNYRKIPSKYADPKTSPLVVTLEDGRQART